MSIPPSKGFLVRPRSPRMLACSMLLLGALVVAGNGAYGQFIRTYGLKGGVAAATQHWSFMGEFTLDAGTRWGVDAGLFMEFFEHPNLSVLLEARYVQKGFSEDFALTSAEDPESFGTATFTPRVDYIVIPLVAKARIPLDGFSPYVFAGPTLSLLLGYEGAEFEEVYKDLKTTEFGGSFGLGCEIPAWGESTILIEGSYGPSFSDAYANEFLTITNSAFEILIGIAF